MQLKEVVRVVENEAWASQLRKGVLELVVLSMLASRESYAARIVEDLRGTSGLEASSGTVYPLLARLLRSGVIAASWHESPNGPPRKYYRLTPAGRNTLSSMAVSWRDLSREVSILLNEVDSGSDITR